MRNRVAAWEVDEETYEKMAKAAAIEGITVEHFTEYAVLSKVADVFLAELDDAKKKIKEQDATLRLVKELMEKWADEAEQAAEGVQTSSSECSEETPCDECIPCQVGPKYVP